MIQRQGRAHTHRQTNRRTHLHTHAHTHTHSHCTHLFSGGGVLHKQVSVATVQERAQEHGRRQWQQNKSGGNCQKYTHTHTLTRTHTHTDARSWSVPPGGSQQKQQQRAKRRRARVLTQTHTRTHRQTHTHTHTRTCTQKAAQLQRAQQSTGRAQRIIRIFTRPSERTNERENRISLPVNSNKCYSITI